MNCDGKMSFGDFIFPINPYLIKVSHSRKITEQPVPFHEGKVSDMGGMNRRTSGEGEFCGEDCAETFARLKKVYEDASAEMLYIPSQRPVYALFEKLELIGSDTAGVIRYSFSFVESSEKPDRSKNIRLGDGEKCLWDFAYESGIDTDLLLKLNPDVKRPDEAIARGRRIYLC